MKVKILKPIKLDQYGGLLKIGDVIDIEENHTILIKNGFAEVIKEKSKRKNKKQAE